MTRRPRALCLCSHLACPLAWWNSPRGLGPLGRWRRRCLRLLRGYLSFPERAWTLCWGRSMGRAFWCQAGFEHHHINHITHKGKIGKTPPSSLGNRIGTATGTSQANSTHEYEVRVFMPCEHKHHLRTPPLRAWQESQAAVARRAASFFRKENVHTSTERTASKTGEVLLRCSSV